jgi:hypothetical protein
MLKLGLATGVLSLVCLGTVAHLFGDQFMQRGDLAVTPRVPAARLPAGIAHVAIFCQPAGNLEIIWHPDANGANPFGFIPTQWTTRPQLLPLTWEVRTVFAVGESGTTRDGRGDFSHRVKLARVD